MQNNYPHAIVKQVYMVKLALLSAFLFVSVSAHAQDAYKCKINGRTVLQDSPCPGTVRYSDPVPTNSAGTTKSKAAKEEEIATGQRNIERVHAFLATREKERKLSDLQDEISRVEGAIIDLRNAMQAELNDVDHKKLYAKNNLAGATYLNSLSNDQQAITTRYQHDIDMQRDRLKTLMESLKTLKAS